MKLNIPSNNVKLEMKVRFRYEFTSQFLRLFQKMRIPVDLVRNDQ